MVQKILALCSGGLDSVVLAHKIADKGDLAGLVSFHYGQRHKKELLFSKECANTLGVPHTVIDIEDFGRLLSGSALTDQMDVPDGHYTEDSMKVTVVPNRNAIMLTMACGVACAQGLDGVATAVHGGDHYIYPDCRPGFIKAFAEMQSHALEGMADIKLYTPFLEKDKADIVREGARLGTDFTATWSCYKGAEHHCGRCGTCVERQEAFAIAGVEDPTVYEDTHFWKAACNV